MIFNVLWPYVSLLDHADVPVFEEIKDGHVSAKNVTPNVVPLILLPLLLMLLHILPLE